MSVKPSRNVKPGGHYCLMSPQEYCRLVGGSIDPKSGDVMDGDGRVLWEGKYTGAYQIAQSFGCDFLCFVFGVNSGNAHIKVVSALSRLIHMDVSYFVPLDALYDPDHKPNFI